MQYRERVVGVVVAALALSVMLAAYGSSPPPHRAARPTTTTTTVPPSTTTTTVPPSTVPGVDVPNVIGMKIDAARFFLREAGFLTVPLTKPCNKGTLTSQSVVASLSIPGPAPTFSVGAVALTPGEPRPHGSRVGITWSDCYPNGAVVPNVTGLTFGSAVHLLHVAGLTWACYSIETSTTTTHPPTTTTTHVSTTTSTSSSASSTTTTSSSTTTTTAPPTTTSTTKASPQKVLSQNVKPGTILRPGRPVDLVMHTCPQ